MGRSTDTFRINVLEKDDRIDGQVDQRGKFSEEVQGTQEAHAGILFAPLSQLIYLEISSHLFSK